MNNAELLRQMIMVDYHNNEVKTIAEYCDAIYHPTCARERKLWREACRKVIRRANLNYVFSSPQPPENETELSTLEVLRILERTQTDHENLEVRKTSISITDPSDKPTLLINLADLHLGARGCDYGFLINLLSTIKDNPFVKMVFVGDLYDNFLRFMSLRGANDSVAPPSIQIDLIANMLREYEDQIIAICPGNHGIDREEKAVGYSVLKKMLPRSLRNKFFEGVGEINHILGPDQIHYRGVISHKGAGNSAINPFHGTMKLARRFNYPDWAVSAHYHRPCFAKYIEAGNEIVVCRTGTSKIRDAHSERYYGAGMLGFPCLILMPDHKEIIPFTDLDLALMMYKSLVDES